MEHGIFMTILIGLLVGVVAKFVHPGRDSLGWIMTIVLGIAGSWVANQILPMLGLGGSMIIRFIAAVVGAVILLIIYGMVKGGMSSGDGSST